MKKFDEHEILTGLGVGARVQRHSSSRKKRQRQAVWARFSRFALSGTAKKLLKRRKTDIRHVSGVCGIRRLSSKRILMYLTKNPNQ